MIVKLLIHPDLKQISIWNKTGDRLFYSDKEADVKMAKELLLVIKKESALVKDGKTQYETEQKMQGYFGAYWLNRKVILKRRAPEQHWEEANKFEVVS